MEWVEKGTNILYPKPLQGKSAKPSLMRAVIDTLASGRKLCEVER